MKRVTLSDWINHVFNHPVTDPAWHWDIDAPEWEYDSGRDVQFLAQAFEQSGDAFKTFSNEQLNQGFWYLVSNSCSNFMFALIDTGIALPIRLRALRSFVPLFEQVMAARCSPHLSHLDEHGANPLNSACYMWWDIMPIHGSPEMSDRAEFDTEVLVTLKRLLSIPHDACRESALHGLGHWAIYYPSVSRIVDEFLASSPGLRPELIAYGQQARVGNVQ